jgi:hypothetical protein
MSKINIEECSVCGEDFCGDCFELIPCKECHVSVCEECFDKIKEKKCGCFECPDGCQCDHEMESENECVTNS